MDVPCVVQIHTRILYRILVRKVRSMKLDEIIKARNASYENMLTAQSMMDFAQTDLEKRIADNLYTMSWAAYNMLVDLEKLVKGKQAGSSAPAAAPQTAEKE